MTILSNRKVKEPVNLTLEQYFEAGKKDPAVYATAQQRLLTAIGKPELVDTSKDERLNRIFYGRTIRKYPAFSDFYGMEETIESLVNFLVHASEGFEEKKQILYLLGPVGGGKSSLAEKIKDLMEEQPIYVLTHNGMMSPIYESPIGLFGKNDAESLHNEYGVPKNQVTGLLSPWAVKRLTNDGGSLDNFAVVKLYPSRLKQIGVSKVEPGDENNQDISTMVGKVNMRKLEHLDANDPDAYSYSGGLNIATQGVMEFVEMFKAPIKMLHPLLTATQEGNYIGTENIGAIPFNGIILAHSNEAEWQTFKNNRNNEAFIDRIYLVKVPYSLRYTEEAQIYKKLISNTNINATWAPDTIEMLARFNVLSRLDPIDNSSMYSKLRIYNGETLKDKDPNAKSLQDYRSGATRDEGMRGVMTPRLAFKILSSVVNFDPNELAADPVHLMYVLEKTIRNSSFLENEEKRLLSLIKDHIAPRYAEFIGEEIQKAYIESYDDYGQNLFDRYISHADAWIEDIDYKDPDTGQMFNRDILNRELETIEKPAGISNSKDFRNEVVKFALRSRAQNGGKNPSWKSYEKIRDVIQRKMFSQIEQLLPVISFGSKKDSETEKKHADFVKRMTDKGYTERQIRRLVEWYMRVKQAS